MNSEDFIRSFETSFEKYRAAVSMLRHLKTKLAQLRNSQKRGDYIDLQIISQLEIQIAVKAEEILDLKEQIGPEFLIAYVHLKTNKELTSLGEEYLDGYMENL